MADTSQYQDPLAAIQKMWGNLGFALPGMVAPTLDVTELDKRIADMKAVEGWMKMNLGVLQMSIQGLEMQRSTLAAMAAFGQSANSGEAGANPFANPGMWPWNFTGQAAATDAATGATGTPADEAEPADHPSDKQPT